MTDSKTIIGADGSQTEVALTTDDLQQRQIDQAQHDAKMAAASAEQARRTTIYSDPDFTDMAGRLQNATSPQIDAWVQNNVANMAQARKVLSAVIKTLAYTIRRLDMQGPP